MKSHGEKRPAVGQGGPDKIDPDMSIEHLQMFLDQFYLIKTPEVGNFVFSYTKVQ